MNCLNPIDAAVLTDYWLAALPQSEEEAVEEHLFACDECGARLREVIALAEELRKLARQGSLIMVVSEAFVKRAAEQVRNE
jgi:anti-sigma factor RsiW